MKKGCGCVSLGLAIVVGLIVGMVGLGVVGWGWADEKIFTREPAAFETQKWGALDEAGLGLKAAPAIKAMNSGGGGTYKMSLKPKEANYLLANYVFNDPGDETQVRVSLGDTAMVVDFDRKVYTDKYVNGTIRAKIEGKDGDFEVTVYKFVLGKYTLPRAFLPEAAQWLEGILETQEIFEGDPWRLMALDHDKNSLDVQVKILKKE